LTLGQELLHLSNYKLNTLADHYGVTFNHHRAFDDALATAKIFIQLLKTRKTLPAPSVDDGK
jgi:DNA polymerase III epsilon subunit-like protein